MTEAKTELNTDLLVDVLGWWANELYARYGHPVYLVGSALQTKNYFELRDIDIVIVLPDEEFANRFGAAWPVVGASHPRWAAEVGKLARHASKQFRNLNFDIKVQSEHWQEARHAGKPKRRLDRIGTRASVVRPLPEEYALGEKIESYVESTPASQRPTLAGIIATEIARYRASWFGPTR